ncbi:MAG: hypothetical protein ACUVUC_07405 [Thermoguttaceae bacterium]
MNELPHFALYPPVYYSRPVAHPYGLSPFAYPAWVDPAVCGGAAPVCAGPLLVVNRFVAPKGVMPAQGQGRPAPLTIKNPYVAGGSRANTAGPKPD